MKRTIEEIRKDMAPLYAELHKAETAEKRAKQKALIGKCYKYQNSYGGGRPSWWLYTKIIGVGDYYPIAFEFQTDCEGKVEVDPRKHSALAGRSENAIEISAKEFNAAWRKVRAAVAHMKP